MKLGLLNSRSIASFSKRLSLITFAHSHNFDSSCLTETCSDNSLNVNLFISSEYIVGSRTDRKSGSHGGTAIIRRNGISLNAISVKTDFCCSAVINLGFPLLIVIFYNPSKISPYRVNPLDIKRFLESLLRSFERTKTLIMGDSNQPDFEAESYHTRDVSFCSLIDFLLEQNFHLIVDRLSHNSNHMLDLIWSFFRRYYRKFLKSQSNYPYSLDKDYEESIKLDTDLFLEQFCQSNGGLHGSFRLLNALKSNSLTQSFYLPGEDKLLTDCPITIANAFNAYFVKSFEKPAHVYGDFSEDFFNSALITFSAVYSALW